MKITKGRTLKAKAMRLTTNPLFLYLAARKIGELGVIGEWRNRLVLLLAGIGRTLPRPTCSVILKGPSSSGKSTLVETVVRVFPPNCVLRRSGLSPKALAHGEGSLANKILLIAEYRCGKDAQQLLRLIQSEGQIAHEFTTVSASERSTRIAERVGMPVVLTTTTDSGVFADDETRFLSIWIDESREQTLRIVKARASGTRKIDDRDLRLWQTAMSQITYREGDFEDPPQWLRFVAERLPLTKMRVRRDWDRFLSFCSAVALCRPRISGTPANITFPDYCVAYRIFEPVLASTLQALKTQEFELATAVARLNRQRERPATVREVAEQLNWKESLVYKHAKTAIRRKLIQYEPGTYERNVKRLIPGDEASGGFLPHPRVVLKNNPELGSEVRYVDPFTGEIMTIRIGRPSGEREPDNQNGTGKTVSGTVVQCKRLRPKR